jgi:transcriptional regulator with XRE-family HTH domain
MSVPPDSLQIRGRVPVHVDFYLQLGRRIAALRRSVGLSQERLGERAHVGASYVAHIEIGSRKPTIDVLLRIAGAVDVPLWRLLTDDRLTTDEKAWDAAGRELGEPVHGLAQQDLQALTYLATRLQDAKAAPKIARAAPASTNSTASRAAETRATNWKQPRRSRSKQPR